MGGKGGSDLTYSTIVFQQIRVDQMGDNSGIFVGNNRAPMWKSFGKQQTGFSMQNGNPDRILSFFSDKDAVDVLKIEPPVFKKRKQNKTIAQAAEKVRKMKRTQSRPR